MTQDRDKKMDFRERARIENIDCVKHDVIKLLNERNGLTCSHCERQYDDSMCNKCLVEKVFKQLIVPHIKATHDKALLESRNEAFDEAARVAETLKVEVPVHWSRQIDGEPKKELVNANGSSIATAIRQLKGR